MSRISLIKQFIRIGIRAVPNRLFAYRLASHLSPYVVPVPRGFQIDRMTIAGIPALWLNHPVHCGARVVLYLHGGGYVIGSSRSHIELASRIARQAAAQVMMLEYRLAPEHRYPAALDDAVEAYKYLLRERVDPGQIVLAGDSAGGGLALCTALAIRDRGLPSPAGVMCLSPWLDLTCSMASLAPTRAADPLISPERIRFFARQYAGKHDPSQPYMSPLHADLHDLPPLLIQVGQDELLLPECRLFEKRAKRHGVSVMLEEWPEMFHVWHFAARVLPEARHAIRQLGEFVRQVTPVAQVQRLNEQPKAAGQPMKVAKVIPASAR